MQSYASSRDHHNYMVAVDGSESSHAAFEVVTQSLFQEANDILTVAHVFNRQKQFLPFNMQPDNIRATYESLIVGYGQKAKLLWEELENNTTTKEHVLNLARVANADLLVVGMHGRKGPKADPTVLGSAVQHLSLNTICPVLMIKDRTIRSQKPGGKLRWAVCTDGSEKSLKAFHVLARLLDKSRDEVLAITVISKGIDVSHIQDLITEHFKSENVQGSFVQIKKQNDIDTVHQTIVDFLMNQSTADNYIDFVAVGNHGADFSSHSDKKYLGSVANGIIRNSNLNVLFIA